MTHKILIVDDEAANLRLLERLFRREYEVISAASGLEALELLAQYEIAVIISDQRMPELTGIEFLKRAAVLRPHTVRIILTGYTDVNALVEAINSGVVYKYVTKPWVNEDLQQTVARALEHHEMNKQQHTLSLQNRRLTAQLETTRESFAGFVASALEAFDGHSQGRSRRVADNAAAIGFRMNLELEEVEELAQAALFFDAGQLEVASALRGKKGFSMEQKRRVFEFYADKSARFLSDVLNLENAASVVRHRFEKWNGAGFPGNLSGEQIPLFSRIIAVAAAYDEMIEPHSAETKLTHDEAIEKLNAEAGTRFDPAIVAAFAGIDELARFRRSVAADFIGMRLIPARFFADTNHLSTAELLQKFKSEPMLAMEVLKSFNLNFPAEATAQLLTAMTRLGEPKLRSLLEEHGLPAENSSLQHHTARAVRRAIAAEMLAAHTNFLSPDDAYTLGLLHDAGEILLANLFPDQAAALETCDAEARARREIEFFGINSVEVSRLMLAAAHLPAHLTTALHHSSNPVGLLLTVAHRIADSDEANKVTMIDALGNDCLAILHLSRADLNRIYERAAAVSDLRREVLQEREEIQIAA